MKNTSSKRTTKRTASTTRTGKAQSSNATKAEQMRAALENGDPGAEKEFLFLVFRTTEHPNFFTTHAVALLPHLLKVKQDIEPSEFFDGEARDRFDLRRLFEQLPIKIDTELVQEMEANERE